MRSCYNRGMKRLWPVLVVLALAVGARAQVVAPASSDSPPDIQGSEDKAPATDGEPISEAPAAEGDGAEPEEKPKNEPPIISVKPANAGGDDEESVAPAAAPRKVESAVIAKPAKKAKGGKPAKGAKTAKGKAATASAPAKAKGPALPPEAPPPPPPAVPLTPITPRNP